MNYLSYFDTRQDVCGGETVIRGTRVTLRTLLASLAEGNTVDEILADFPTVSAEDLQAAVAFAAAFLKKPAVFPVLLASAVGCGATGTATADQGPSFSCDGFKPGSIEEMICTDTELAALDRRLAEVYAAAQKKATNESPPVLKAEQRGWIKGRNETFWEHQGEAKVTWGYVAPEMHCKKLP